MAGRRSPWDDRFHVGAAPAIKPLPTAAKFTARHGGPIRPTIDNRPPRSFQTTREQRNSFRRRQGRALDAESARGGRGAGDAGGRRSSRGRGSRSGRPSRGDARGELARRSPPPAETPGQEASIAALARRHLQRSRRHASGDLLRRSIDKAVATALGGAVPARAPAARRGPSKDLSGGRAGHSSRPVAPAGPPRGPGPFAPFGGGGKTASDGSDGSDGSASALSEALSEVGVDEPCGGGRALVLEVDPVAGAARPAAEGGAIRIDGFEIGRGGLARTPLGRARAPGGGRSLRESLVVLGLLGRGASGTVRKALHVPSLRLVAIKDMPLLKESQQQQLLRELRALYGNAAPLEGGGGGGGVYPDGGVPHGRRYPDGGYPHPEAATEGDGGGGNAPEGHSQPPPPAEGCAHIIRFHDAFTSPGGTCVSLVVEYMDGGSLQDLVDGGGCASEPVLSSVARQILRGLAFLHARRRLHRDVKPSNLLLNHRGEVKLCDFGLARDLDVSNDAAHTFVGTYPYMSPERIAGGAYAAPSDVWAFGLSLLAVAEGAFPLAARSQDYWAVLHALRDGPPPRLGEDAPFSDDARDFFRRCLEKDPEERASAEELLRHPFVRGAEAEGGGGGGGGGSHEGYSHEEYSFEGYPHRDAPNGNESPQEEGGGGWGGAREGYPHPSPPAEALAAREDLREIAEVVKDFYESLWRAQAEKGLAPTPPDLGGGRVEALAGQLGLPLETVRAAFRAVVAELRAGIARAGGLA